MLSATSSPKSRTTLPDSISTRIRRGAWCCCTSEKSAKCLESGARLREELDQVRNLMQRPGPSPAGVARQARAASTVLDGWLIRAQRTPTLTGAQVRGLMQGLAGDGAERADALDWDEATQFYLGLGAMHQALGDLTGQQPPAPVTNDLIAIRNRLKGAFVPGFDSPRRFDPLAEPTLRDQFEDIRKQLGP